MKSFNKSLLAGLVGLAIFPILAHAEPTELDTVVVSATRSEQSNVSVPGSITIIDSKQIAASGAKSLDEILRGQGGLQVSNLVSDGTGFTVSMRGFGATAAANTLLLIDGRRLNNPDLAGPDFSNVHLKDIKRIEIIQGSAGTLFGDQAVGGVINIITKTPTGSHGYVRATAGSYRNNSLSLGISNLFDNGLSYRFSAVTRKAENFRDRNDVEYGNVLGLVNYDFKQGSVFFEYQEIRENAQRPGGLFATAFAQDRRAPRFLRDFNDTDTNTARLGLRYALSNNWQLEAEFTDRDSEVIGRLSNTNLTQSREVEEFTPRLIGSFNTQHGESLVTIGSDIINSDYSLTAFGTTTNKQKVRNLYAQVVYPLTKKISGTIGARSAKVENDLMDGFTYTNGVELDDSQTVFEAGLSMQFNNEWRGFIRRDENFRFAKLDENTSTLGTVVGLDTQTGISYELGTSWQKNGHSAKATLFQLRLKNEIDYDPVNFVNINLDPTVRNGLILETTWQASKKLSISGQYTAIDAEFDEGSFKGNDIPFVAKHTAHLSANYEFRPNWNLFGEAQYIGSRYAAGDLSNQFEEVGGYTIFNMNLNYQHKNWLAGLRINNLTNKKYSDNAVTGFNSASFSTEVARYAAPERNISLTVQYSY